MEDAATRLMTENLSKNMSDVDEYPAMMDMHSRCISILGSLWHGAKDGEKPVGSATTGSSEAIHLGGLAMKRRWQEKRRAEGKDTSQPNILMGANAQVALEKFARYFEVEARILPVSEKSRHCLDPALVRENIDENTIGVFVILGSTYTGHFEPVEAISDILDAYEKETGVDIPIHVDGASGAFIAPFTHARAGGPKWDFVLPRVKSINVSGHKFGLVFAGVGWIIWRDEKYLPKHLVFELHYLGGTEESYTLNFSRPGAQIIGQYFNLIHLGFNGYRSVMENCLSNARLLSCALEASGYYVCVSDVHRPKGQFAQSEGAKTTLSQDDTSADFNAGLPVVAFRLSDDFRREHPDVKQVSVSNLMRAKQYIIPSKSKPPVRPRRRSSTWLTRGARLPAAAEGRRYRNSAHRGARVHVAQPAGPADRGPLRGHGAGDAHGRRGPGGMAAGAGAQRREAPREPGPRLAAQVPGAARDDGRDPPLRVLMERACGPRVR